MGLLNFFFGGSKSQPVTQQAPPKRQPQPQAQALSGQKVQNGLDRNGQTFSIDHAITTLNARRAYYDSPHAKGIIDSLTRSVIGTGLRFESTIKFEELGISQEEGQQIGSQIEAVFDRFASSRTASLDRSMDFYQIQALYYLSRKRDGENFNRIHYSNDQALVSPVRLSFIDPTQICGGFTYSGGQYKFDDGIERNVNGEEVRYSVTVYSDVKPFRAKQVKIPAVFPKSKRQVMLHGFKAEYPGQQRGYSAIGHVLQEFQDLQTFAQTSLDKAVSQSGISAYVKPSPDSPASKPFEGVANQPPSGTSATSEELLAVIDGGSVSTDTATQPFTVEVTQVPEAAVTGKGTIIVSNLESGETLEAFPNSPGFEKTSEFVDGQMEIISPSCGVPYEVLKMLWGTSFSASRGTLLQFQEVKEIERDDVASDFLNPVLKAVISEAVADGDLFLPGFSDPKMQAALLSGRWVGSGVPNIDPLKMANSVEKNLGMSLTTVEREAKNLNGSVASSNIAKNKKSFEEMPIPFWSGDERIEDEPIEPEDGEE